MMEAGDKTELIDSLPHFGIWHGRFAWHHGRGCNRINKYSGTSTQGFANYLLKAQKANAFEKRVKQLSVVVGHDCRNNGACMPKQ